MGKKISILRLGSKYTMLIKKKTVYILLFEGISTFPFRVSYVWKKQRLKMSKFLVIFSGEKFGKPRSKFMKKNL